MDGRARHEHLVRGGWPLGATLSHRELWFSAVRQVPF